MRKRNKVLLISLVSVFLIVGLIGYLTFRPTEIRQESVKFFRISEAGQSAERLFKHMKDGFNRLKHSDTLRQQFLSDYESLPSEEYDEYVEVAFIFTVKNKSLFVDMKDVQVMFDNMESETNPYLYTKIVPETINIQPGEEENLVLSAYLYVGDMENEEIEQLLKGMTVEVSSDVAGLWNVGKKVAIDDSIPCENKYYLE